MDYSVGVYTISILLCISLLYIEYCIIYRILIGNYTVIAKYCVVAYT